MNVLHVSIIVPSSRVPKVENVIRPPCKTETDVGVRRCLEGERTSAEDGAERMPGEGKGDGRSPRSKGAIGETLLLNKQTCLQMQCSRKAIKILKEESDLNSRCPGGGEASTPGTASIMCKAHGTQYVCSKEYYCRALDLSTCKYRSLNAYGRIDSVISLQPAGVCNTVPRSLCLWHASISTESNHLSPFFISV